MYEDLVLSDVHLSNAPSLFSESSPHHTLTLSISTFVASIVRDRHENGRCSPISSTNPPHASTQPQDSPRSHNSSNPDLSPPRKRMKPNAQAVLADGKKTDSEIEATEPTLHFRVAHTFSTTLEAVGNQVWRGALALGNALAALRHLLPACACVEVGCGTGLAGLVAGCFCETLVLTDCSQNILRTTARNIILNAHLLRAQVKLQLFDFTHSLISPSSSSDVGVGASEMDEAQNTQERKASKTETDERAAPMFALPDSPVVYLAADVVYDNPITEALITRLSELLADGSVLLMSTELRPNFTLEHMSVCSPAHEYLWAELQRQSELFLPACEPPAGILVLRQTLSELSHSSTRYGCLVVEEIDIQVFEAVFENSSTPEMKFYQMYLAS